jgi:predicted kinase
MEITGRSNDEVDTIIWEDDYFALDAMDRFVARLAATEAAEQFLFRESEFDCAFRQVDMRLAELAAEAAPDTTEIELAQQLRDEVWEGHEQVGAHNAERAAMAWRRMELLVRERGNVRS